ncbi:type III-A CRISPR-associated protein Csm2 [Staphylococcus intermedius]|uniref:CRISPR system Cms protein Csm2 n=1 Tax=Staphylococcus intermedius NCTC 11048 TaxID=1141106 RepID=A0A380G579_STAIN|nr:type III-A CRISPR-associated protein Csm2 [Staphylococcus intermedius]PCF64186.1 type III-A CRISPR-associated protein Csm2 [Staphylococcus intermedius]PCF78901.1 type III-A CRISPR-associated protein Csm2 [Staphylococcus intermedius]PCF79873.1 type III-A CRISPR-associated protein Csm2 [Staphylococcus intermedius]PCF89467.1 type III-A CRISPR-associated protein Csm2 [Staphylococcus intermedius]PNZ52433.1 type III-A CRISPR-associated protein Csm2 [Staphylococcus intermedius NCTC 11048]
MILAKTKNGIHIDLKFAHDVIKNNTKNVENSKKQQIFEGLTSSKLRSLLEQVNRLYTIVFNTNSELLSDDFLDELEYLKVKFYYEAAREQSVDIFLQKTFMIQIIDKAIKKKSKKYFLNYCKYFEALVAYAKFYQGED